MYMNRFLNFLVLVLVIVAGCNSEEAPLPTKAATADTTTHAASSPLDRLPDNRAGEVVRRAIEQAGGWAAWQNMRSLDYQKTITSFDEQGNERRRLVQHHQYQMHPQMKMRIAYEDDEGRDLLLNNDGNIARKWIDGVPATTESDQNHAWNSTFGSHYVMGMPFKLTDPGVILTYAGQDTLGGIVVDAVQVDYEEGAGSAGGMHTWTYFFDASDGRLVANHLRFGPEPDDHDFTEYTEIREIDGVHLSIRRDSYHSNADKERLAHTTSYVNSDIRVNELLSDSLFTNSQ